MRSAEGPARPASGPADHPGLVVAGILARLPYGMGAVGLLTTGVARGWSPTETGVLAALFTTALAVALPLWGRAVDRVGLPRVLLLCTVVNVLGTAVVVLGGSFAEAASGAVLLGAGLPPVAGAMRATWNRLLPEGPPRVRAAAFESVLAEGVHIVGRLVVAATAAVAPWAVLPLQSMLLVVGGTVLGRDPRVQPPPAPPQLTGAARRVLRRAAPLLVLTLLLTTAHGGVATAIIVSAPGTRTWSGPVLFSAWGLGSLLGGLLLVRLGRGRELPGLVPVMLALTAPTCLLMLPAFALGPAAAAAGLLVLGLPIAPTLTGLYLYAQRLAPAGRENEVYALVQATIIAGFGVGTTLTGALDGTLDGAAAGFVPACLVTLAALALSIPLYVASARTAEPSSP